MAQVSEFIVGVSKVNFHKKVLGTGVPTGGRRRLDADIYSPRDRVLKPEPAEESPGTARKVHLRIEQE